MVRIQRPREYMVEGDLGLKMRFARKGSLRVFAVS
jgi:hypothetical protein